MTNISEPTEAGDTISKTLNSTLPTSTADDNNANDIKNMTVSDLLNIINAHQQIEIDRSQMPPKDASLEDKMTYALNELETTKRQLNESKIRYHNSINNLQKATEELQNNSQILLQNKLGIQENKIESQRTRIELNLLKQLTIDEIKNLNTKIDLLLSSYNENFSNLHQRVISTLNNNLKVETIPLHKQRSIATKKSSTLTPEGSPMGSVGATHIATEHALPEEKPEAGFRYKLAKPLTNVRQIWEEYEYGLYGQPSVKWLDQKYKNRWRHKGENTTYLRRRKIFLAVENCIKMGVPEADAIAALEELRVDENGVKRTMAWLFDNIPDGFPESHFQKQQQESSGKLEKDKVDNDEDVEMEEEETESNTTTNTPAAASTAKIELPVYKNEDGTEDSPQEGTASTVLDKQP